MAKINIEEIDSYIDNLKNVIPLLTRKKGDIFYIDHNEKVFSENAFELKRNCIFLDDFEYLKQFSEKIGFGGFGVNDPSSVEVYNCIYGLGINDLLKKDVYFALLFMRHILEGLNNEFKYKYKTNIINHDFHFAYVVGNTYKLAKRMHYRIHYIYGNCYDYGLTKCVDNLYDLAIQFKSDLRTSNQKMADNIKETGEGCLDSIVQMILALIIFGGIGFILSHCSN